MVHLTPRAWRLHHDYRVASSYGQHPERDTVLCPQPATMQGLPNLIKLTLVDRWKTMFVELYFMRLEPSNSSYQMYESEKIPCLHKRSISASHKSDHPINFKKWVWDYHGYVIYSIGWVKMKVMHLQRTPVTWLGNPVATIIVVFWKR